MKGDPNKRNKNKYCRFHRNHGHDTDDCYDLKQQIENLIKQGKLRHFVGRDHKDEKLKAKVEELSRPLGEIRVIIGGTSTGQSSKSRKTYLKAVQNVQLSGRSPRTSGVDDPAITFTDEDVGRIHHPHNDAIVITLLTADYTTKRVLVDNGSSTDILYYPRLPANEAWTRSTSPSMLTLGGIRRDESTTCRNHYTTFCSGVVPAANSQGGEFSYGRLFIFL